MQSHATQPPYRHQPWCRKTIPAFFAMRPSRERRHLVLMSMGGPIGASMVARAITPVNPLPVDSVLPEVVETLRGARRLVLVAPPGAGKTTRVPPAILRAGLLSQA